MPGNSLELLESNQLNIKKKSYIINGFLKSVSNNLLDVLGGKGFFLPY